MLLIICDIMSSTELNEFIKRISCLPWEDFLLGLSNFMLLVHYNEHYKRHEAKLTIIDVLDMFETEEFYSKYVNEKLLDFISSKEIEVTNFNFADTPPIRC